MMRLLITLWLLLFYTSQAYAVEWQYKLDLAYGMRTDKVDYSVDGLFTGAAAGVSSAMQLQTDNIAELQLNYRFIGDNQWYVKGFYHEGFVQNGTIKQSSYNPTNANTPLTKWQANNMRGSTSDTSFALGRQWRWYDQYAIAPLLGYSRRYQDWKVRQGNQLFCNQAFAASCWQPNPAQVVDGAWHSSWEGPWLGVDIRYHYGHWTGVLEFEHHQVNYDSRLTFSGVGKPASIESIHQTGQGTANTLSLGASYWINGGFLTIQYRLNQLNINNTELHTQAGGSHYFTSGKNNKALTRTISIGYTSQY